jgi:hypothetical protein
MMVAARADNACPGNPTNTVPLHVLPSWFTIVPSGANLISGGVPVAEGKCTEVADAIGVANPSGVSGSPLIFW